MPAGWGVPQNGGIREAETDPSTSSQDWNLLPFPEALAMGASQIGLRVEGKAGVSKSKV